MGGDVRRGAGHRRVGIPARDGAAKGGDGRVSRGRGYALKVKPIAFACAVLALLNLTPPQSPSTTQVRGAAPMFNREVAPILFNVCVGCHRPGGVGPMSLLTFESARMYAEPIRQKVVAGDMPPCTPIANTGNSRMHAA